MNDLLKLVTVDQQKQLLALLINGPDFVSLSSAEGNVTYINQSGRRLLGIESIASTYKHNSAYVMPHEIERLQNGITTTLINEGRWIGQIELCHSTTGEPIPVHATTMLIYDERTNAAVGRATIARDLRQEQKALTQQQKLMTLISHSKDLMSLLTLEGKNEYINDSGKKLLGIEDQQDVEAIHISNFHTPDQIAFVENEVLPSVMKTGEWSGHFAIKHFKTGEIIPLENNCIRIDDPYTGKPTAIGAVMRDLRPEISARAAILEREEKFRTLITQAPVAIGLLEGEDLMIAASNTQMLQLWGKKEAIIGMPLLKAIPELKGQPFIELLGEVKKSHKNYYGNEVLAKLNRNGKQEDAYFNFVYAATGDDQIIVVATEVTLQVLNKRALVESEQRFKNLVLDAPIATALYRGKDLIIEIANPAMIGLWGKDSSVLGQSLITALPELEGQPFIPRLQEIFETGVTYHSEKEMAQLVVDGQLQRFWFNYTYKPLFDTKGDVYGILNMAVDVSSLVQMQQARDDFFSLASHELKTPLTTLKGYHQLLQEKLGFSDDSTEKKMLDKIGLQIDKLTQLIIEMLDVSHIQVGKMPYYASPFDLRKLTGSIVEDMQQIYPTHEIQFTSPRPIIITADQDKIAQVMTNLLDNAIKYSPQTTNVIVDIVSDDQYVTVTVRDFGIGIANENREKIFEQFYRVNHSNEKTYPGLGVGLYISSEIVKRAQGRIWVEPAEGGGSTFYVRLPLHINPF